jgi:hypothetical protein
MYLYFLYLCQGHPKTWGWPRQVSNTDVLWGQDWQTLLRTLAQIADNFWRNSFVCGNLNLPIPYFRIFQWLLVPLIGWHPRQLPGWCVPYTGPDLGVNAVLFSKHWNVYACVLFCVLDPFNFTSVCGKFYLFLRLLWRNVIHNYNICKHIWVCSSLSQGFSADTLLCL